MKMQRHEINRSALRRPVESRHLIVLACFLATLTAYVERVGFSIAYTAMAKTAGVDEATKGTILSAFYWGYGVSQVSPTQQVALGGLIATACDCHCLCSQY